MIKKIIFLIIILIITFFLLLFIFLDKVIIKKTIEDIEKDLKVKISLNEDYKFTFLPNLSLLTKFNLKKKDYNLFIKMQNLKFIKIMILNQLNSFLILKKLELKTFLLIN